MEAAASAPWRPGDPITDDVPIADIAKFLAFGQNDPAFDRIASLLGKRGCTSVAQWRDWTKSEFYTMLKIADDSLKKKRNAYLRGFEVAIGHELSVTSDEKLAIKAEGDKASCGGDMMQLSRKLSASQGFNPVKWQPDALVFDGVPKKGDADFIDDEKEKLYLDKLWLAAQVSI